MQEAERRKKAAEEMKEKQKRKRLEELMKRRKIDLGANDSNKKTTEKDLLKNAEKRAKEFDASNSSAGSGGSFGADPVTSTKDPSRMYIKEFKKVVEAADVIVQVLDARDPLRSRFVTNFESSGSCCGLKNDLNSFAFCFSFSKGALKWNLPSLVRALPSV